MSLDLDAFLATVRRNCMVSDARDNGVFSMCTLFLRLRNLYKWEHGLPPWQEEEPAVLLDWVASREEAWQALAAADLQPLAGGAVDPFDTAAANRLLAGSGLFYGAGYGRSLKPVFFVAEIQERRTLAGVTAWILDRELVRELASPFALLQDGNIVLRLTSYRYQLWDWIQEAAMAGRSVLGFALGQYGVAAGGVVDQERLRQRFEQIVVQEAEAVLYHELGELAAAPLAQEDLAALVAAYPMSAVELVARAVKDLLADTADCGTLAMLVQQRRAASVGFYAATLDGMRRELGRDLGRACEALCVAGGDDRAWQELEETRIRCRRRLWQLAEQLAAAGAALRQGEAPAAVRRRLDQEVLASLGLRAGGK